MANPTPEFLAQLRQLAREYGWMGDFNEIEEFVRWCHDAAGEPCGELKPFESEEL